METKKKDRLVIGLCGKIAAGKGTVADYLCSKYNAKKHTISGILADILQRLYLSPERKYLQAIGATIRRELGSDIIINTLKKDIEKDKSRIIILDGIRYMNEVEMVRSMGGIILYIDAPQRVRYERCLKRAERGESNISFEQFLENEKKETEQNIEEIAKHADYILENSKTMDELFSKVDKILKDRSIII